MIVLDTYVTLNKNVRKLPQFGPNASLMVVEKFNPLEKYWIEHAQNVLMTLPGSGQLTLKDIQTELSESGQASLRSMSAAASKSEPDLTSDFYGYTHSTSSLVKWTRISASANWTIVHTKYKENAGAWTSFFSSTRSNTVDGTVGYEVELNISIGSGGAILCGSTDGGSDLGSTSNGGIGIKTWTLSSISTSGSNMFFANAIS